MRKGTAERASHLRRTRPDGAWRRLAALAIAALLAGCASSAGIRPSAVMKPPPAGRLDAGSANGAWPSDRWWLQFQDPTLTSLIGEALTGQPTLRLAEARVRAARQAAAVARAALYPTVSASAFVAHERLSEHDIFPPPLAGSVIDQSQLALGTRYELDFWDKNRAALEATLSEAEAADAESRAARLVLATSVAEVYFRLRYALEQEVLARNALDRRTEILKLARERSRAGLDTMVTVRQAQAEVSVAREQIVAAENAVKLLRDQLAALLGQGPAATSTIGTPAVAAVPIEPLPRVLPVDLLGRRPDIVASRLRVQAASARITVAKADFMPDVNLLALIGLRSIDLSNLLLGQSRVWAITPAVHLPIFEAGRLQGALGVRDAQYDMAVERYNATVIAAVRETSDAIASYDHATRELAPVGDAVRRTDQAYQLALSRYRSGLTDYIPVLIIENALLARRSLQARVAERRVVSAVRIVRSLGGGYAAPRLAATP